MKTISFSAVTHVGKMDRKSKRSGSLEGAGLSVSVHPMAWSLICKIGTEGFSLRKQDAEISFLDARKLSAEERAGILAWGRESGYLADTQSWKVTYFDEDIEERAFFMFASKDEAVREAAELLRPRISGPVNETKSTPKLLQETFQDERRELLEGSAFDLVLTLYVQRNIDVDGIWWSERLDPYNHSAPRGVLFDERIPQFEVTPRDFRFLAEDEEFDVAADSGFTI
jgi:hypothetical protein